jgi:starch phosphorylase
MKTLRTLKSAPLGGRSVQENTRTGLSADAIQHAIIDNLYLIQGRVPRTATKNDWYMAVAYSVRDRILQRWMQTIEIYMGNKEKSVRYL